MFTARLNGPQDYSSNCRWKNVLCSNLNHAWTTRLARREEHPEVKIVSEDHESVGGGVIHDPIVGRRSMTDR
jgi:hypothetical protein